MILATSPQPWLAEWNRLLLEKLFVVLPHGAKIDTFAQVLTLNTLISSWIYAFAFYLFWQKNDERRTWRRVRLAEIALASVVTVAATLLVRPWVGWPSPARASSFRGLYPEYFWGNGSSNSFPSHSTLVYFLVAIGLWRVDRRWSIVLAVLVLPVISLPRIYLGGHYPVDVAGALVLAAAGLWLVRRLSAVPGPSNWMRKAVHLGWFTEVVFFLWLFELGEGFHGSFWILRMAVDVARRLGA
jgi:membrane-associated phospholipid phosphatase